MSRDIVVGKNTLESLTSGMYSDAKVIFREYIQNSVDSIDEAVYLNIVKKENAMINIQIDKKESSIIIMDNGVGISSHEVKNKLLDIGNSNKSHFRNRGFRGIGRLAGLSYCDRLTFETSCAGENTKNTITFDGSKLEKMLIPGDYEEYDLLDVINEVSYIKREVEDIEGHYFKVTLTGVKNTDHILDYNDVKEYLCQVAPLPYNLKQFHWGEEIKEKLKLLGISLKEYNIYLEEKDRKNKLYKLYTNRFNSDIRRKIQDKVKDIQIRCIEDKKNNIQAVLWFGISNFQGSICNNQIKGLRYRKGNIQIGDRSTLNDFFKEDRFNGWFQGEVFVVDPNVIPNARRDNFEKNESYLNFIDKLEKIGNELSKTIRNASKQRADIFYKVGELITQIEVSLANGFNSNSEKDILLTEIKKSKDEIASFNDNNAGFSNINTLFDRLKNLSNKVESSSEYKIESLKKDISKNEQNILDKVFNVITEEFPKPEADKIVNTILSRF